jgi:uncharacterized membrane protein HdeD (DUF308 family)
MTVLSIICGVILIVGGISMMCTPFATFLSAGYFISIMLLAYGIVGLIKTFQKRSYVLETVMSILALIFGIIALVHPEIDLVWDGILLYMVAFWFLFRGIFDIVLGFRTKSVNSGWIWGVIVGILSIILGCYSFAHPAVAALTTGILIGLYFVDSGIGMIIFGTTMQKIKDDVTIAAAEVVIENAADSSAGNGDESNTDNSTENKTE